MAYGTDMRSVIEQTITATLLEHLPTLKTEVAQTISKLVVDDVETEMTLSYQGLEADQDELIRVALTRDKQTLDEFILMNYRSEYRKYKPQRAL